MSFKLSELLTHFPGEQFVGESETQIQNVISFQDLKGIAHKQGMSWVNDKNAATADFSQIHLGLLLLSRGSYELLKKADCNFLICENPRAVFTQILSLFFKSTRQPKIESTAIIHKSVTIDATCYIGHHVVIEANCKIGAHTTILHNSVLLENTIVGDHVQIGCNNTIGNYGFGYEKNETGDFQVIEHLGSVVIHDYVEIHNNTCVDRGVLGVTEIYENAKIDNLVHVAHGVNIGRNSLIIAHAMLGGSAKIGEDVWIAPATSIKNQIKIADRTLTGIGAVILKDTAENEVMIGNPATTMTEYKKWSEQRKKIMGDQSSQ